MSIPTTFLPTFRTATTIRWTTTSPAPNGQPVFLYGVPSRDKARLTTIMLSHFLLHGLTFESVIVFADQQEIPRLDLARLTNVAGTAVASLDAEGDLRRKISRLAA